MHPEKVKVLHRREYDAARIWERISSEATLLTELQAILEASKNSRRGKLDTQKHHLLKTSDQETITITIPLLAGSVGIKGRVYQKDPVKAESRAESRAVTFQPLRDWSSRKGPPDKPKEE